MVWTESGRSTKNTACGGASEAFPRREPAAWKARPNCRAAIQRTPPFSPGRNHPPPPGWPGQAESAARIHCAVPGQWFWRWSLASKKSPRRDAGRIAPAPRRARPGKRDRIPALASGRRRCFWPIPLHSSGNVALRATSARTASPASAFAGENARGDHDGFASRVGAQVSTRGLQFFRDLPGGSRGRSLVDGCRQEFRKPRPVLGVSGEATPHGQRVGNFGKARAWHQPQRQSIGKLLRK